MAETPSIIYQTETGVWETTFGGFSLRMQTLRIDFRSEFYPEAVFLGKATIGYLLESGRVRSLAGPSFRYSGDPGELKMHRRIYAVDITA